MWVQTRHHLLHTRCSVNLPRAGDHVFIELLWGLCLCCSHGDLHQARAKAAASQHTVTEAIPVL